MYWIVRISKLFGLAIFLLISLNGVAQDRNRPKYLRENDKSFLKMVHYASPNGWIEFREDTISLEADSFFEKQGNALGVGTNYLFKKIKDESDERGYRVQRFQLYYKNLEIEGAEYSLSTQKGRLKAAFGHIAEGIEMDVSKPIDERKALEIALTDRKQTLNDIKDEAKIPKGNLLLARLKDNFLKENYRLTYSFDIPGNTAGEPYRIYVDAESGVVVKRVPLIHHCFGSHHNHAHQSVQNSYPNLSQMAAPLVASTFIPNRTRYLNGQSNLTFETESFTTTQGQSAYRLSAYNNALNTRIATGNTTNWDNLPDVPNSSTSWNNNVPNATTAHWLVQRVHQYYQDKHQRNGINGSGAYPRVVVDLNAVDAHWNLVDQIRFGFGPVSPDPNTLIPDPTRTLVNADVVGHEYTHAVTQFTANLSYTGGESGPLNESFSDIMGTAFERYLFPNDWNWDIGEDSYQIRDMANPSRAFSPFVPLGGQPDTYLGPRWDPGNEPHTNSGVMNKWFHTLYTGRAPNGEHLTPISFDNAINIVYRALRFYLHSSSGFADARDATMAAARDLYGNCSLEHRQVQEAWRTANLLAQYPPCNAECNFTATPVATNVACGSTLTLTANCSGSGTSCTNITYDWTGPNINNTTRGQSVTATAPSTSGTYTYQLLQTKVGCDFAYTTLNVNVNCSTPPATLSGCYTIKSVQTNQLLEAISGNVVEQRSGNGSNSQKWKAESASTNQYRFVTQNGSGLAMSVNALNNGEIMRLVSSSGDNRQLWALQDNGSGAYRINGSNGATWDMRNYGNDPQLQIYGTTSEGFQNQRLFRFEATGCPSGGGDPNPPTGGCTTFTETCSGNSTEVRTITISVATEGDYTMTTSYKAWERAVNTIIRINGVARTVTYPQTSSSAYQTQSVGTVHLTAGNNTIGLSSGTDGGIICFNSICVSGGGGGDPNPPTNPTNPSGSYEGTFDGASCGNLWGWVYTPNSPNAHITVELLANGNVVSTFVASEFRQDLQNAGKGNGEHGFNYAPPSSIKNGQNQAISLRVLGNGFVLTGSPRTINCSGGRLSTGETESVDHSQGQLTVYPNPAIGQFTARFMTSKGQSTQLSVVDLVGRKLIGRTIAGKGGVHEEVISMPQEANGVYLIQIQQGHRTMTEKVILQPK